MTPEAAPAETEVGSYFVANYPPFSVWTPDAVGQQALPALHAAPAQVPLGLYLHIPFCRKRCHFCYFRVYTEKNAAEINNYLDAGMRELERYATAPFINGRKPSFIYFGGGTPSLLEPAEVSRIIAACRAAFDVTAGAEITLEANPESVDVPKRRRRPERAERQRSHEVDGRRRHLELAR